MGKPKSGAKASPESAAPAPRAWPASERQELELLELKPNPRNARRHPRAQLEAIKASMRRFGWTIPVLADEKRVILAGHGRWEAAQELVLEGDARFERAPVIIAAGWSEADKRAYVLADNQLATGAEWDTAMLREELETLRLEGDDLQLLGFGELELQELFAGGAGQPGGAGPRVSLRDRFGIPPFSVLDARQGWWQDRKRAWLAIGLKSELGRGDNLLKMSETMLEPDPAKRAAKAKAKAANAQPSGGGGGAWKEFNDKRAERMGYEEAGNGTSIFDPVLAELALRWFCPPKGQVLDPFAGGSVRGVVASRLGRSYLGVDLRAEQIEANRVQAKELCKGRAPRWLEGDSSKLASVLEEAKLGGFQADMVLSCPPYADLERYSDDPRDLSTMKPEAFWRAYLAAIAQTVAVMREDSFAVWVVGEVRSKALGTAYMGFVPGTIAAFEKAGARFYNEAILVTPAATLAMRARKAFEVSRKLGKTHQNVLVFVKGDPEKAAAKIGEVEFGDEGVRGESEADRYGEKLDALPASV